MSNGDDKSIQMLSMPALGRHFDLGTVYDAVRDAIIPGYPTFLNGNDLKNVQSTVINHTDFSIIASDKFADKFQELKFNGSLQVSILCGQIELGGSANYLSQKKSTSRESSVHLTLKRRTAVKKLVENNMAYRDDVQTTGKIGSATHIVTQIEYGAEATFTFTKKLSETENQQEVNGQLKLGAEKIQKCLAGNANVGGSWADTNQENEDNIECHFQGNFELPNDVESPTTYKEAIEFAKKFLQLSSDRVAKDDADGNKSLGVPVIVWLYPLKDAQEAPALRYEIPHWMASQCFLIMENYSEVEDKLVLMLEDPLLENLSPLQNKLQHFQRYLTSVIAELKIKLWEIVVGFRGGKIQEKDFKIEMDRIGNEKFTFNSNRLKQWLAQKNKELCLIKRFQDEAKSKIKNQSKVHFFPSATTLQEQMTKFPVDCGLEFSFSYLSRPEPFMELLKQKLGTIFFK
ncbi:stonustoxin subunit alpha-like [Daphnia pulicaria]|uniref:stonustoxin subunit alpha-like n=1 Tax=Daphnia pulicaria TaxID=35523 RepID=UPI001EEA9AA3|nr:stonustoxin subunit alpha-like [Daphnia pulicaria]